MRSLLARFAVLGAFAVAMTACGGGSGTSLPFAGAPNNAGGSQGTIQSGSNGLALLRFVNGAPGAGDAAGNVDVCIDQLPITIFAPTVGYGRASLQLYGIAGGISHTVAVFPTVASGPGSVPGSECATAPGPYFGTSAIAVATIVPGNNVRMTVVLGGTAASGTLGLYVFNEPTFPTPAGPAAISHNAAPAYSKSKGTGVGFGICTTTVTPCAAPVALSGAQNVAAPKVSSATVTATNSFVQSSLASVPPGFYDGTGVPAGNPVPVTSVAAPGTVSGQAYIVQLYGIDAPAGGLNLVALVEQSAGYGF